MLKFCKYFFIILILITLNSCEKMLGNLFGSTSLSGNIYIVLPKTFENNINISLGRQNWELNYDNLQNGSSYEILDSETIEHICSYYSNTKIINYIDSTKNVFRLMFYDDSSYADYNPNYNFKFEIETLDNIYNFKFKVKNGKNIIEYLIVNDINSEIDKIPILFSLDLMSSM